MTTVNGVIETVWAMCKDWSPFLIRYRFLIAAITLVLATFSWTNWYFSPTARLSRLANDIPASGILRTTTDQTIALAEALHAPSLGTQSVYSSCVSLPTCDISVTTSIPLSQPSIPGDWMSLAVTVEVTPVILDQGWLGILPPRVQWRPVQWRWAFGLHDDRARRKGGSYSGGFADLDVAPNIEGGEQVRALLLATGTAMQKVIQDQ